MFQKFDIPIEKQQLLEIFERYRHDSFSLADYYESSVSHPDTQMLHVPLDEFDIDLPITSARYMMYNNSDLFIHKDRKVRCRLGLILSGDGPIHFYDEDKNYIDETDFKTWTLIDTDVFHSVPEAKHRLSFQFGFEENYEQMFDRIRSTFS